MGRQRELRNMKSILGFPEYSITKNGEIWSKYKNKWLKPIVHHSGYLHVHLYHNKKRRRYLVHHAVLNAFVGKCPKGMECRHLDGNKQNNRLSNLKWGTKSENVQDTIRHGTHKPCSLKGEKHPNAKLTECDVRSIVTLYEVGLYSQRVIADWYKISQMTVSDIITRKKWKHLWKN